jgi:hypothetical protein
VVSGDRAQFERLIARQGCAVLKAKIKGSPHALQYYI